MDNTEEIPFIVGFSQRAYTLKQNGVVFQWRWNDNNEPVSPEFESLDDAMKWADRGATLQAAVTEEGSPTESSAQPIQH